MGLRYRTVGEFTEMVDWDSGLTDEEALEKGVVNSGQTIPRFQRVVGWHHGRPLVTDPDGKDGTVMAFVPQIGNKTGIYEPRMGIDVFSREESGDHYIKE